MKGPFTTQVIEGVNQYVSERDEEKKANFSLKFAEDMDV